MGSAVQASWKNDVVNGGRKAFTHCGGQGICLLDESILLSRPKNP